MHSPAYTLCELVEAQEPGICRAENERTGEGNKNFQLTIHVLEHSDTSARLVYKSCFRCAASLAVSRAQRCRTEH